MQAIGVVARTNPERHVTCHRADCDSATDSLMGQPHFGHAPPGSQSRRSKPQRAQRSMELECGKRGWPPS